MAQSSSKDPKQQREAAVGALCERLDLEIDLPHLAQALTHPSYANEQREADDNQRLEFLGDAVLGLCVSEQLMEAFSGVDEGQLTVMRAALVNSGALAAVARRLDLADALKLGRGADTAGERYRANVLADALEAVIGAVFIDRGLEAARALCRGLFDGAVALLVAEGGVERDAKSRLQELAQAHGLEPPTYTVVDIDGPHHARRFTVRVEVDLTPLQAAEPVVGEGDGRSKKLAEQTAASIALDALAERLQDER